MAVRAYIEWEDGLTYTIDDYERYILNEAKEEYVEHALGFKYPAQFAEPDENGAVI